MALPTKLEWHSHGARMAMNAVNEGEIDENQCRDMFWDCAINFHTFEKSVRSPSDAKILEAFGEVAGKFDASPREKWNMMLAVIAPLKEVTDWDDDDD